MKRILLASIIIFFFFTSPCYCKDYVILTQPDPNLINDDSGADANMTFWDLPLSLQLVTISSLVLALGWKMAAVLIARIKDENNDNRLKILQFIERNPGISVNSVKRDLSLKRGTIRYHISVLKEAGKIVLLKNGNYVSLFKKDQDVLNNLYSRNIEPYLQGITCKKICWLIYENPGITNKEISEELGLTKSAITSHIHKLAENGYLVVEPNGKSKNYYFKENCHPDMIQYFERID
ncbi:MAG: winged helix-turn-helix transcriptional regulator [Methanomethylovorans sp.]|uniref:winged helix-turn-helix transcriptional regulator n=1 Tax=Methanomethylovorans sp. TaxID=2758717 RepID=UPI003530B828